MAATAVTPSGVRDGDPDALAGLCDRRGPAVLAYCEVVAGHAAAPAAAADAFGSFRSGVVATPDLASLNPEALLISATRHAAARHASANTAGQCTSVPALLAARADRSITLADHDWLEQHLATCWSCRAPVARFEAADRAYRDPPNDGLAPEIAAAIVAAMTAAAPVRGNTEETAALAGDGAYAADSEPQAPATNGNRPSEEPSAVAAEPLDQPTSAYEIPARELELPPAPDEPPAPRERRGRGAAVLGALGAGRSRRAGAAGPTVGPPSEDRAAAAAGATASGRRPRRDVRTGSAIEPRAAGGASLPRPSRIGAAGAVSRREHSRLRAGVVLPVALVIIAIIAALAVAGVFGGGEPESAPQSFTPTESVPSNTAEAPVVVVPGAASRAAAVEKAKARARAAERKRKAAAADSASGDDAPATAPPPPAAAATPAAAPATTPPPPPAAANTGSTSGKPKIDAGNGATGAEQLPPPQDTSTIPEIAPPVEPSVAPGG